MMFVISSIEEEAVPTYRTDITLSESLLETLAWSLRWCRKNSVETKMRK